MSKTIGILGGMGPEATLHFFQLIIRLTKAETDQEHVPVLIWNNPQIKDRTGAILRNGPSPLPQLIEGARLLERGGADMIAIPCVTAHFFHEEVQKQVSIPVFHLVEEAGRYVDTYLPSVRNVGVIATRGTLGSGLFQNVFSRAGRTVLVPDDRHMEYFREAVYTDEGIKAGFKKKPKEKMLRIVRYLEEQGAEAIIAGCSEIPLVLDDNDLDLPFINPLKILAIESIKSAGYETKTN